MAGTQVQLRRGTTAQHSTFTGAEGEVTVDTTKDTLVVHDGSTAGGIPLAKASEVAAIVGVTDGDKGDITVSSSGASWAVDNNAITYAKMQDVTSTSRVIGRKTAGSGDPEECTLSEVLDFIGSAAQGDILYRGASSWARLVAGTDGQYLKTQGAGGDPAWADVSAGGMTLLGTLTTTSGTTHTLTGLTLTAYKQVVMVFEGVSHNQTQTVFFQSIAISVSGAGSSLLYGGATLDLNSGTMWGISNYGGTVFSFAFDTTVTTASTSIGAFTANGATFDAGSIRIYGVK